jgi:UBX domain-containing protein 7
MQEEVDRSGTGDDTGVRSPIPQRNDILVDPSTDYFTPSYGYGGGYPSRGRGSVLLDTIITVGSTSRGIFNQATPSIWNADDPTSSLADATGGSSEMSDKANRLARMYRPPFEIMNRATLEEVFILSHEAYPQARDTVRSEEPMKWIMVNIMNSQEFPCQILNRDLWSDKTVQQTIRENFYFLQVSLAGRSLTTVCTR